MDMLNAFQDPFGSGLIKPEVKQLLDGVPAKAIESDEMTEAELSELWDTLLEIFGEG